VAQGHFRFVVFLFDVMRTLPYALLGITGKLLGALLGLMPMLLGTLRRFMFEGLATCCQFLASCSSGFLRRLIFERQAMNTAAPAH
jgi:hypothetical protein